MKNIACHLSEQIQETINYTTSMLKESQQKNDRRIEKNTRRGKTGKQCCEKWPRKKKREWQEHIIKTKKDLKKIKNILKSIGSPCSAFESGFETVKNIFKKTLFNFGKRRCCCIKICGSVAPFPDINMGNMDLDSINQLNEWVKYLAPDFKVKLGDVPYIKNLLDGPSVANIREKMLNFVSNLFQILLYLKYTKKVFL